MKIITTAKEAANFAAMLKQNSRIALVPTMGNLHAGHLYLIKAAQQKCDKTMVSIFVNPLQFAPNEDFASYPRTVEEDIKKLEEMNIAAVFMPQITEIYPNGMDNIVRIELPPLSKELCGASRPGFFSGVAAVVAKLFNIIKPDIAVFGEKDYQQLLIIKQMVQDLNFGVEIVAAPIVREENGLALSSRNQYLTAQQKQDAAALFATLQLIKAELEDNKTDYKEMESYAADRLYNASFKPDYFSIRCAKDLSPAQAHTQNFRVLAAAWMGTARLIDNIAAIAS